jgi:hypothetical protein
MKAWQIQVASSSGNLFYRRAGPNPNRSAAAAESMAAAAESLVIVAKSLAIATESIATAPVPGQPAPRELSLTRSCASTAGGTSEATLPP